MPTTNLQVEVGPGKVPHPYPPPEGGDFKVTLVESPSVLVSAYRQIRYFFNQPKTTVPAQYYRGEAALPATDMRPWFMDLPSQLKFAFEKPQDPIGLYNYRQHQKRALCGFALAALLAVGGWFWLRDAGLFLD
jgi:hypothetical protein